MNCMYHNLNEIEIHYSTDKFSLWFDYFATFPFIGYLPANV